jgi:hypothetical protein
MEYGFTRPEYIEHKEWCIKVEKLILKVRPFGRNKNLETALKGPFDDLTRLDRPYGCYHWKGVVCSNVFIFILNS